MVINKCLSSDSFHWVLAWTASSSVMSLIISVSFKLMQSFLEFAVCGMCTTRNYKMFNAYRVWTVKAYVYMIKWQTPGALCTTTLKTPPEKRPARQQTGHKKCSKMPLPKLPVIARCSFASKSVWSNDSNAFTILCHAHQATTARMGI